MLVRKLTFLVLAALASPLWAADPTSAGFATGATGTPGTIISPTPSLPTATPSLPSTPGANTVPGSTPGLGGISGSDDSLTPGGAQGPIGTVPSDTVTLPQDTVIPDSTMTPGSSANPSGVITSPDTTVVPNLTTTPGSTLGPGGGIRR